MCQKVSKIIDLILLFYIIYCVMKGYNFSIIIERDKDGYFAFCPKLQGCYSQGDTYEEAMENIKDAIKLHKELL